MCDDGSFRLQLGELIEWRGKGRFPGPLWFFALIFVFQASNDAYQFTRYNSATSVEEFCFRNYLRIRECRILYANFDWSFGMSCVVSVAVGLLVAALILDRCGLTEAELIVTNQRISQFRKFLLWKGQRSISRIAASAEWFSPRGNRYTTVRVSNGRTLYFHCASKAEGMTLISVINVPETDKAAHA